VPSALNETSARELPPHDTYQNAPACEASIRTILRREEQARPIIQRPITLRSSQPRNLVRRMEMVSCDELDARVEAWRQAHLNTPHGKPVELHAAPQRMLY
jgi:hypothetical protein